MSGQLTWSHYLELLKCDDSMEMQFYFNAAIKEGCGYKGTGTCPTPKVREY